MLLENLGKKIMIFDGGMGSEIEKKGLAGFIPEELNIMEAMILNYYVKRQSKMLEELIK